MHLRRRAASAVLALTTAFSVVACTEADNGNNTLTQRKTRTTPPGAPQSTGPARAVKGIDLEAKDSEFVPKEISGAAGTITIVMRNTGAAPHTFTNADLGVDVNADAGKTAEIELKDVKPGTYHFICKYHEALGMVGDLKVT